jgi:hypothetical protein
MDTGTALAPLFFSQKNRRLVGFHGKRLAARRVFLTGTVKFLLWWSGCDRRLAI